MRKKINWKDKVKCEMMPLFYNKTFYGECEKSPCECEKCILKYQEDKI